MKTAKHWIDSLQLKAHPEGGWYAETYCASGMIAADALPPEFGRAHAFSTAIYYLLEKQQFSAFHRIVQDELWHHYEGGGLIVHAIMPDGSYTGHRLGKDIDAGELPQIVIPAGAIFAAELLDKSGFVLTGCTVAPAFQFADFELFARDDMLKRFPQHASLIERMTR